MNEEDPFDSLLTLEDRYYQEGYTQGAGDGARAGRIEGRLFGYETAFAKFVRLGKVHGRAIVLQERLRGSASCDEPSSARQGSQQGKPSFLPGPADGPSAPEAPFVTSEESNCNHQNNGTREHGGPQHVLPPLSNPQRVEKHIRHLYELSSPDSIPTQNNEDAVADVDERLRRAEAKTKLLRKVLGEGAPGGNGDGPVRPAESVVLAERQVRLKREEGSAGGNIEDFGNGKARTRVTG